MEYTTEQLYQQRLQRFHDAVALKEPDRVPILTPGTNTFDTLDAGYTMAETIYDYNKAMDAIRQFLTRYEPDSGYVLGTGLEGLGPMLEKAHCKTVTWAGMPGHLIDDRSVHQFLEFELLEDGELAELSRDLGNFVATKFLPRVFGLMEPMAHFDFKSSLRHSLTTGALEPLAAAAALPDVRKMMDELAELQEMFGRYYAQVGAFAAEVEGMGFPIMTGPPTFGAFDFYSDYLRGTILASMDLYDEPELVEDFLKLFSDMQVEEIRKNPPQPGRIKFMPMHKAMDGFMSAEHFARFYWPYQMKLINAWVEAGAIPYVYTESSYNTRMEFLRQLPPGKTIVHFESIDMELAKRELKDIACVSGVFPAQLLTTGTKQQVVDEAKRIMDIFAPGGGYIFDFDGGLYDHKRENMEALFDTIKTYGKY